MNENVDYFKDQKDQVTAAIETAILQCDIIKSVMPSVAMDNLLRQLGIIKSLYPPNFKQFIISQCIEQDSKLPNQDFNLYLGSDTYFKITVELKNHEKEPPPDNIKKKWYQF